MPSPKEQREKEIDHTILAILKLSSQILLKSFEDSKVFVYMCYIYLHLSYRNLKFKTTCGVSKEVSSSQITTKRGKKKVQISIQYNCLHFL